MKSPLRSPVTTSVSLLALWARDAHSSAVDRLCVESCQQCLPAAYFADADAAAPAAQQACGSRLSLESTYLCMRLYCGDAARDAGLVELRETCGRLQDEPIPGYGIIGNYTDGDVARVRKVQFGEAFKKGELREAVAPAPEFFGRWWRTLDSWDHTSQLHYIGGLSMSIFWAVVIILGIVNRLAAKLNSASITKQPDRSVLKPFRDASAWLRRHIFVPAAFGHRRAQRVWWCTIPQRSQVITIAAFSLLNVFFTFYGYRPFPGDIYYPSVTDQVLRQVSDRTGIMSFACFPVIWLFGMRNSLLSGLTGWDFGTWSNFHRWVARVATLQAVVHSLGYTALIVRGGGWHYYAWWWTQLFWWTGQVATIAMSLLMGFSIYWLRRHQYETFLILHIVLSIVVLATMLGHVSIFNGQYDLPFWIPAIIWIFDRVFRVIRIFAFNIRPWSTKAITSFDETTNIIRLSVPCQTSAYVPRPGTYYYLMILNDIRCWESHPFTLASVGSPSSASKCFGEDTPLLQMGSDDGEAVEEIEDSEVMTFLIRPYDSFTGRLRDLAIKHKGAAPLRVVVEGPYGDTWPLHRFGNVVFVVGGSGIVVALSYLKTLLADSGGSPSVQIHWAIREERLAEEVLRRDFGDMLSSERLTVELYISTPKTYGDDTDIPSSVQVRRRRLDAYALVGEVAERVGKESLAVVACGPARMADDTRRAAVDRIGKGRGDIEYFEEDFQW